MKVIESIHQGYVFPRRVRILTQHMAELAPQGASILDVGCGDGLLDSLLEQERPDLSVRGIEVLIRQKTYRPIELYDGKRIPFEPKSFDAVMMINVLHHTEDPLEVLRQAATVARRCILLKDHTRDGLLAGATLRFMDRVGNARHGVALPYNDWSYRQWMEACETLRLKVAVWQPKVGLYPWWADWAFGRTLQFVARLEMGS
jgi:SAM-dependent methyltransferase